MTFKAVSICTPYKQNLSNIMPLQKYGVPIIAIGDPVPEDIAALVDVVVKDSGELISYLSDNEITTVIHSEVTIKNTGIAYILKTLGYKNIFIDHGAGLVDRGPDSKSYYEAIAGLLGVYDSYVVGSEKQKELYEELGVKIPMVVIGDLKLRTFLEGNPSIIKIAEDFGLDLSKRTLTLVPTWCTPSRRLRDNVFPQTFVVIQKDLALETMLKLVEDYNIILRPHPNLFIHHKEIMDEFSAIDGVHIDTSPDAYDSIFVSSIVVGDYSSLNYEAVRMGKPVIKVNFLNQKSLTNDFIEIPSIEGLCEALKSAFHYYVMPPPESIDVMKLLEDSVAPKTPLIEDELISGVLGK